MSDVNYEELRGLMAQRVLEAEIGRARMEAYERHYKLARAAQQAQVDMLVSLLTAPLRALSAELEAMK